MSRIEARRVLTLDTDEGHLRERLAGFAAEHRFRVVSDTRDGVELARGGLAGEVFSFDVRGVPTRLRVAFEMGERHATRVTAVLEARTRFGFFTKRDRAALERQLDVLVELLSAPVG